jgi:oxygen-dependent protoporphyrinogen oxidase
MRDKKRLVVIGAGISGLAAAQAARRTAAARGLLLEILVLEKEDEVGGKALSLRRDGWLVEAGPGTFLDNEPEFQQLLAEAGLEGERIGADSASKHRFLYRGGKLLEVPAHPLRFAFSGLLGPAGLLRMAMEPFIPRRPERPEGPDAASILKHGENGGNLDDDESIWEFAARRLGKQAADRLIAPMILGVYAGDVRRLSLQASLPRLAALEREHGSLIRGMIARRRAAPDQTLSAGPSGEMSSFETGLQSLPIELARRPGMEVRCAAKVESLQRDEAGSYRLIVAGDSEALQADAVIVAGEAWAAAELMREVAPRSADRLAEIEMPPVAVVALGYDGDARSRVPPGFGVLVPRDQGTRTLGCVWDSYLFPGRSPQGCLLVRAMLGGSVDPAIGDLDEGEVAAIARRDVATMLRLDRAPVFEETIRWQRAIPQYDLRHTARVRAVQEDLQGVPGLFLAGNSLDGVSFARSGATGRRQGIAAAEWLAGMVGQPEPA